VLAAKRGPCSRYFSPETSAQVSFSRVASSMASSKKAIRIEKVKRLFWGNDFPYMKTMTDHSLFLPRSELVDDSEVYTVELSTRHSFPHVTSF
jgi:hypothetical protein